MTGIPLISRPNKNITKYSYHSQISMQKNPKQNISNQIYKKKNTSLQIVQLATLTENRRKIMCSSQ